MKKDKREAVKLFIWALGIFVGFNLLLFTQELIHPTIGANIGAGILGVLIVIPICTVLIVLGFYRLLRKAVKDKKS